MNIPGQQNLFFILTLPPVLAVSVCVDGSVNSTLQSFRYQKAMHVHGKSANDDNTFIGYCAGCSDRNERSEGLNAKYLSDVCVSGIDGVPRFGSW